MDAAVVANAKTVVEPLQRLGYETLSFVEDEMPVVTVDKAEARRLIAAPLPSPDEGPEEDISHIRGWVRIKAPLYEGEAKWTIMLQGRGVDATMGDHEWLHEFQNGRVSAPPRSSLDVSIEVRVKLDNDGNRIGAPAYTITKVHGVELPPPATRQPDLLDG
jgi:hypothetical protein